MDNFREIYKQIKSIEKKFRLLINNSVQIW